MLSDDPDQPNTVLCILHLLQEVGPPCEVGGRTGFLRTSIYHLPLRHKAYNSQNNWSMQTCFNSCHLIPILVLYNQSSLSFNSNFCEKVFANSLKTEIYIKIERFLTFCSTIHVCLKKGCFDFKCSLSQNCFNRVVYKLKEIMGKVFFFFYNNLQILSLY